MVKIPVLSENLSFERLDLHRHYVVIDCDFTVYLILNPIGDKPLSGTDIAVINIGSWQIDAWKFLVKDNFPNEAGFSAVLAWDKTLEQDTEQGRKAPRITESDVDIADSVSSLKGQPVNITGFSLEDNKSLKVSTLENEFCNVRSFTSWGEDDVKSFPTDGLYTVLKVGDAFPDHLRRFVIKEFEGSVSVYCPFMQFNKNNAFLWDSNNQSYVPEINPYSSVIVNANAIIVKHGECFVDNSVSSTNVSWMRGTLLGFDFRFTLDGDGIITNIKVTYSFIGYAVNASGGISAQNRYDSFDCVCAMLGS